MSPRLGLRTSAGLGVALFALLLGSTQSIAHDGEGEGEGKDAAGEVDPDFPTTSIIGDSGAPGAACIDGKADYFPCDNVNLSSYLTMDDIGGGRGSDVWGWTDPATDRRYVIAGRDNGTAFVDVTNERRPVYLGNLPTSSPQVVIWRDIKVHADHAYIVSEAYGHGMQVFDLTQLRDVDRTAAPVTFTETAHYSGFQRAHNIAVNEDTGYVYAVGAREDAKACAGGLHMVDVRTPASPEFAGCVAEDGYTHDTQCVVYDGPDTRFTGREICLSSNEDTLTIVDVTDKSEPEQLSRTGYDRASYAHQGWLTPDGKYFLMGDEGDETRHHMPTRTLVWDVSDLRDPRLDSTFLNDTTAIDHNMYVTGQRVFQSNYRSGLRVLTTRGIAQGLDEVGYFDTWPEDDDAAFSHGTWSNYPFFENGLIVVHGYDGLFLLRPTGPAARR